MEKQDADDSAKPQVIPYRTAPQPEEPISGIDTLAGIFISAIALAVISFVGFSFALGLGALTQSPGLTIGILVLTVGAGIWFLHRLAQGEKDINKGLMIGVYIGIGMYFLLISTCGAMLFGFRI